MHVSTNTIWHVPSWHLLSVSCNSCHEGEKQSPEILFFLKISQEVSVCQSLEPCRKYTSLKHRRVALVHSSNALVVPSGTMAHLVRVGSVWSSYWSLRPGQNDHYSWRRGSDLHIYIFWVNNNLNFVRFRNLNFVRFRNLNFVRFRIKISPINSQNLIIAVTLLVSSLHC